MDRLSRIAAGVLIRHAVRVAGVYGKPRVRTAGRVEFVKDTGPIRRDIRVKDFRWTPEALRELAKILWASQRAQSYAMAAFRLFSKIPSAQISPDGLLGGRGYIQNIKDMRTSLAQAVEVLSSFTDTVDDEINAAHWQSAADTGSAEDILDQTEEVKQNPAGFVEEEFQEENPQETFDEPIHNPDADELNPKFDETDNGDYDGWIGEDESEDDDASGNGQMQLSSYADTAKRDRKILERRQKAQKPGERGSQLPGGTGEQHEGQSPVEMVMHTTTPEHGNYASAIASLMHAYEMRTASNRVADSSVDPEGLPGPRIRHIGPGEDGFNDNEQYGSDDPAGDALNSGVETERPVFEDWCADGVSGYENPTDGDPNVDLSAIATRLSSLPQTYSWLPGADNSKNLDYYALGMSEEDLKWLREHSQPDPPPGLFPKKPKFEIPDLWKAKF